MTEEEFLEIARQAYKKNNGVVDALVEKMKSSVEGSTDSNFDGPNQGEGGSQSDMPNAQAAAEEKQSEVPAETTAKEEAVEAEGGKEDVQVENDEVEVKEAPKETANSGAVEQAPPSTEKEAVQDIKEEVNYIGKLTEFLTNMSPEEFDKIFSAHIQRHLDNYVAAHKNDRPMQQSNPNQPTANNNPSRPKVTLLK